MTISDEQAGGIGALTGLSEWWSEDLWKYSLQKQNKTRKDIKNNHFSPWTLTMVYKEKLISVYFRKTIELQ